MNKSGKFFALAVGITCLGIGAGMHANWTSKHDTDSTKAESQIINNIRDYTESKRTGSSRIKTNDKKPSAAEILSMAPSDRAHMLVDLLPSITARQLNDLALQLDHYEKDDQSILHFLIFTRWGEVDYESATTFHLQHPDISNLAYIELGRAAVDIKTATISPMGWERKRGLEYLLEQLSGELALKVARGYLHLDDDLVKELSAIEKLEAGRLRAEKEAKHKNPEAWARSLSLAGRKGDWDARFSWDQEALELADIWGRKDAEAASKWFRQNAPEDLQNKAMQAIELGALYEQLDAETDPESALTSINEVLNRYTDPSGFQSYDALPDIYTRILKNWINSDRVSALKWLCKNGKYKAYELVSLQPDLDQAKIEIDALPASYLRAYLSEKWAERWALEQPEESMTWLRNNRMIVPQAIESDKTILDDPFAVELEASEEADKEYFDTEIHNSKMESVFSAALDHDLPTAMEVASDSKNREWILKVVRRRELSNPRETIEWLSAIDSEWDVLGESWYVAFQNWTREDPYEAAIWVDALPDGNVRNTGTEAIISDLILNGPNRDYHTAIAWALSASTQPYKNPHGRRDDTPTDAARTEFMGFIFRVWSDDIETAEERTVARQALQSVASQLDSSTLNKLQAELKPITDE